METKDTYSLEYCKVDDLNRYCRAFGITMENSCQSSEEWIDSFSNNIWHNQNAVNGIFVSLLLYLFKHDIIGEYPVSIEEFLELNIADYSECASYTPDFLRIPAGCHLYDDEYACYIKKRYKENLFFKQIPDNFFRFISENISDESFRLEIAKTFSQVNAAVSEKLPGGELCDTGQSVDCFIFGSSYDQLCERNFENCLSVILPRTDVLMVDLLFSEDKSYLTLFFPWERNVGIDHPGFETHFVGFNIESYQEDYVCTRGFIESFILNQIHHCCNIHNSVVLRIFVPNEDCLFVDSVMNIIGKIELNLPIKVLFFLPF